MLCLHEAGFHVSAFPKAEHNSAANDRGNAGDACDTDSIDRCGDWCLDVEVKGLDLEEVRFEDSEELFVVAPVFIGTIPSQEWELPTAISFSFPLARAPPALPQSLIVAQTTVLLI